MAHLRLFTLLAMSVLIIPGIYGLEKKNVETDSKKIAESSKAPAGTAAAAACAARGFGANAPKGLRVQADDSKRALERRIRRIMNERAKKAPTPKRIEWNSDESYTVSSPSLRVTIDENKCIIKTR